MPTIIDIPGKYDTLIGSTNISDIADGTLTGGVAAHESALVTTAKAVTLNASSWSGSNTYTITDDLITATSNQDFYPDEAISAQQLEALQLANIVATSQSVRTVVLTAFGDKPTINIPIKILFRGEK